jgi:hypothetical protein
MLITLFAYVKPYSDICTTIINQQNFCLMETPKFVLMIHAIVCLSITVTANNTPIMFAGLIGVILSVSGVILLNKLETKSKKVW